MPLGPEDIDLTGKTLSGGTVNPTTLQVGGNAVYRAGGTDVPVTDGGTGASDAATARTNLGIVAASTSAAGIMETATLAEVITGTDAGRAISPDSQHTKITYVSSQHQLASATQTEVTQLQQTLVAGTYRFSYFLICQTSLSTVGLTFAINYTGTVTKLVAQLTYTDAAATASTGVVDDVANATTAQVVGAAVTKTKATTTGNLSTGTGGASTQASDLFIKIEGVIVVSDGGDFELWHGSETTNNTSVEVGSSLMMTRVN